MDDIWNEREQKILEAIAAEREKEEPSYAAAARAAVSSLADEQPKLFQETIASLTDDHYLDTAIQRNGSGGIAMWHIRRMTPKGLRAAHAWPGDAAFDDFMATLERAIDKEPDLEKRSKLEKLRDSIGAAGKIVVTPLLIEFFKRLAGLWE